MKKMMLKFSQRERLYIVAGCAVLLAGGVVYPGLKAATAFRVEQQELIDEEAALLADLKSMLNDAGAVDREYEKLRSTLHGATDWLFPAHPNPIIAQNRIIKLLNDLGPDLDLEVTPARSSLRDAQGQMNLNIRGRGRYPEILSFLYRIETHRPLISINAIGMSAARAKKKPAPRKNGKQQKSVAKTPDPALHFRLAIEINSRPAQEGESS